MLPPAPDPVLAARYRALALEGLARPAAPFRELPARLLVVDVRRQRLGCLGAGRLEAEYPVSTAAKGLGSEEGSFRTPPGWHRIHARIGEGEPEGMRFVSRQATGEVWTGEAREEDLILTRILSLDGLEPGVNQGPGRDSWERYIYLHGTNREDQIGQSLSHGCIRLRNADMLDCFARVDEGDPLLVVDAELDGAFGLGRLHFAGVAGSGMSALAQFVAMRGGRASGSDRAFDRGQQPLRKAQLEGLDIGLFAQDGSGIAGDCSALVYSTAVEPEVPDFAEAQRLGVPLLHRSELLAHLVARMRTVAVTGTSGKSTTVAMIFELLRGAGLDPSVITGGELRALQAEGHWGNAWAGSSDLLVIEADESDGSLVRYHPALGLILNLQKDHKEEAAVAEMFRSFAAQVTEGLVVGEAENLREFRAGATAFGLDPMGIEGLEEGPEDTRFRWQGHTFRLPVPGRHNLENALAALEACRVLGVAPERLVAPLAGFQGVARRFQVLGTRRGVEVVDDFGHNPAKVSASIRTARRRAQRVLAVFQPHGYGPMRFLRKDFVAAFAAELGPEDRFWMLEVFYAGGTATRDFSSADIVAEIAAEGAAAEFAPSRDWLVARLAAEARAGDLILVMGARDPSLTELAQALLDAL